MADKIQIRRSTEATWALNNTVLAAGELGVELDTFKLKVGDGLQAWNDLPYIAGGGSASGDGGYVYLQSAPATVWNINHNLGARYAVVEIIDTAGNSLSGTYNYPVINFVDDNNLTVTFDVAQSGRAVVVATAGAQGVQGFTGSQGNVGFTGSRGFTGSQGIQGIQGIQGNVGFTGSQGPIGYTGSQGFTGSQGATGFTGSAGVTGGFGIDVTAGVASLDMADLDVTAGGTGWTGNIIPSVNDVYTLGSPTRVWRDLYVGPGSIYVNGQKVIEDNSGTINVTADPNQNLSISTTGTGDLELSAGSLIQLKQNVQMSAGTSLSMAGTTPLVIDSPIDMNGNSISNMGAPTGGSDVANKTYVDTNFVALTGTQSVGGDKTFTDNIIISGNLTVNGTQTILNTTTLEVEDDFIGLVSGQIGTPALNAGIQVNRGSASDVQLQWNEAIDRWQFTNDGISFHNIPNTAEQANWDTAFGWGDHASAGYLTSVPAEFLTQTEGDARYLQSFTETDPTVPAHVKSITTTEKSNWNTAFGWGNHASAGYAPASTTVTTGTNQTVTGRKTFSANSPGNIASATGSLGAIEVFSDGANTDAAMAFHVGSDFACYFGLDGGINDLAVGGWSMGANSYRILHLGNYTSFVPTITGTGASGTWGINITGNAGTATTTTNCSRSILAGTGLTGGGDLTANRTISLAADQRLGAGLLTYHGGADTYLLCQDGATAYHRFFTNGTEEMRLTSNGTLDVDGDVVAFSTTISSDARLKQDVVTLTDALDIVKQLRGVRYTWNHKTKRQGQADVGLIAQEVQPVLPELVKEATTLNTEDETHLTVDYSKMVAVLIEAVKELSAQNAELAERIQTLENK